jgi:hypothetical protein
MPCVISKNSIKVLVIKPEGKRPVRTLRGRYEDNIKVDFKDW